MKKILICLYKINNYGGITTYVEELKRGFDQIGVSCDLVLLATTDRKPYVKRHSKRPGNSESSFKGMTCNSDTGWGGVQVMSYANKDRISEFHAYAKNYDLIYWCIPVPSWSELPSVPEWRLLYQMKTPQIAAIHDGNFRYLYPHLNAVAKHLKGVACVHGAAYESAKLFNGNAAFIPNPHPLLKLTTEWDAKRKITFSAHMWKGWKHMELAVKAAPHLKRSKLILGGDGIERRYMTSPTKCPPKYTGIWDAAMKSKNAKYVDMLSAPEMREYYSKVRVMLDPSFSKNYNKMGSHFNRSIFEAYNSGVIPVCCKENMNLPGIFKAGLSHLEISAKSTPEQIAAVLDKANNLTAQEADKIVTYGRNLIKKHFRAKNVASDLIKLAQGKGCGLTGELRKGEATKGIIQSAKLIMAGGRPKSRNLD